VPGRSLRAKAPNPSKMIPPMAEPATNIIALDEDDEGSPSVKLSIPVSEALSKRIDDYRFGLRVRTESEAVRRLIIKGLKAEGWWRPRRTS
jgi:hypothetical protein